MAGARRRRCGRPGAVLLAAHDGGHARDGPEALASLPLQHLLARLVVAVVGQRDGKRGGVVLLRSARLVIFIPMFF